MYTLSQNGIKLIKGFEDFMAKAYQDEAKIWTIGYGTILYPSGPKKGQKVKQGDTCTEIQAAEWLQIFVNQNISPQLNKSITANITQNQFDALSSMSYNVGTPGVINSTLLKKINSNPNSLDLPESFIVWNKVTVNGVKQVSTGLILRRAKECILYYTK